MVAPKADYDWRKQNHPLSIGVMVRHFEDQRGGIGTYTKNLLINLFEMDHSNRYVLFYNSKNIHKNFEQYLNVQEQFCYTPSKFLWDQMTVPRMAKYAGINIIYNPKLSIPLFTSCKTVFVMHGGDWVMFPQNYLWYDRIYHRLFAHLYCRKADAIISVSHSASEDLKHQLKFNPRKIYTIYHGVGEQFKPLEDEGLKKKVTQKYGLPKKFMLFVGQIYPMKNFGGILRALANIGRQMEYKLVVAGKPSLKFRYEMDLIKLLNLTNKVVFTGWVDDEDLPVIYNLAEFLVFPSLYEGFGIPIIEAMACGCPVLTSNRGAPAEVAGNAALLVDPTQHRKIAKGMNTLITNRSLYKRLRRKGMARAKSFTWEKCAGRVLDLFVQLGIN